MKVDNPPAMPEPPMLHTLPYDLLLNVGQYLSLYDIHALHLTCRSLHGLTLTRTIYRHLALSLLTRCRPLPLPAFTRISDLDLDGLRRAVNRAEGIEQAWNMRGPRPRRFIPTVTAITNNSMLPFANAFLPIEEDKAWYKVIHAPKHELIDWLSPITSVYTLCATKSGKVFCWDVESDQPLVLYNAGPNWELWKCRVEFDQGAVYFTMAKVKDPNIYDDTRIMDFSLMRLSFDDSTPTFHPLSTFRTAGVVMNVFLLDPSQRLLAAFVWGSATDTIGLFVLFDWEKGWDAGSGEYVFVDTGIPCNNNTNWSCILTEDNTLVIHSEESEAVYQHFYPMDILKQHLTTVPPSPPTSTKKDTTSDPEPYTPRLTAHLAPLHTIHTNLLFPKLRMVTRAVPVVFTTAAQPGTAIGNVMQVLAVPMPGMYTFSTGLRDGEAPDAQEEENVNPFPTEPWYPESAHFVRQWWPSLPNVPRLSCTVVLLAAHDHAVHRHRYVLAQHYFSVPLTGCSTSNLNPNESSECGTPMAQWYTSTPFEIVCVIEPEPETEADQEQENEMERPRPLLAVDFGCAVWVEYVDGGPSIALKFVTFPSIGTEEEEEGKREAEGVVRTLEIPAELDLGAVETVNIDQSQAAIILSVRDGRIFILRYE